MNLFFSLISVSRSKTGQTRKKICPESLTKAVKEVKNECSLKKTADKFNVPKSTYMQHVYCKIS